MKLIQENPSKNTVTVDVERKNGLENYQRFSLPNGSGVSSKLEILSNNFSNITRLDMVAKDNFARVSIVRGTTFWTLDEIQECMKLLQGSEVWVQSKKLKSQFNELVLPDPERVLVGMTQGVLDKDEIKSKFEKDGGEFILMDVNPDGDTLHVDGIQFGSCADCQLSMISTLKAIKEHIEFELNNRFKKTSPFDVDPIVQQLTKVSIKPISVQNGFYVSEPDVKVQKRSLFKRFLG